VSPAEDQTPRAGTAAAPPEPGGGPGADQGLTVEGLSKSFGVTRAVRDFSYRFLPGRVYAVVGENGSGKSTLIKMLAGAFPPDRGSITVGSQRIRHARPRVAISAGIATCLQEILIEGNLSTLDNLFLWDQGWLRPRTPTATRRKIATRVLAELSLSPPPLTVRVDHLSLAARQLVVIARAMVQPNARILLFDEVTSALDQSDSGRVLEAMERRAADGCTVIFTSHRMDELQKIGHEIIILRNGALAGVLPRAELTSARMLELMSGLPVEREHGEAHIVVPPTSETGGAQLGIGTDGLIQGNPAGQKGEIALRVSDVRVFANSAPVQLSVNWGEITGLAGLDGHGQAELLKIMGGVMSPGEGVVEVSQGDHFTRVRNQRRAVGYGVSYLPRDRKTQGIFPTLSVLENFGLPTAAARTRFGLTSRRLTIGAYDPLARQLAIKAASRDVGIASLSGGNQQKALIARWLAANPRVILLDDPTRGVDVGTKVDLYRLLEGLAGEGRAVVLVSTELEELATLCDRVVVVRSGSVAADLRRPESGAIDSHEILEPMLG
jgi:ABC-type sugar transport system ATPase subunit